MSEPVLCVLATCRARDDRLEAARRAMLSLIEPTRKEDGCLRYELHQDREDPAEFVFVEEWTSEEALARHAASEHVRRARRELADLLERPIEIRRYSRAG